MDSDLPRIVAGIVRGIGRPCSLREVEAELAAAGHDGPDTFDVQRAVWRAVDAGTVRVDSRYRLSRGD